VQLELQDGLREISHGLWEGKLEAESKLILVSCIAGGRNQLRYKCRQGKLQVQV